MSSPLLGDIDSDDDPLLDDSKRRNGGAGEQKISGEHHLAESETFKRLAEIDITEEAHLETPSISDPNEFAIDITEEAHLEAPAISDPNEFAVKKSNRKIVSAPCEEFYLKGENGDVVAGDRLRTVHEALQFQVLDVIEFARRGQPQSTPPEMPEFHDNCKCGQESDSEAEEISSDEGDGKPGSGDKQSLVAQREIARKQEHPAALSQEMCFNEAGQMNDGPVCKCSWASRKSGIRHGIFAGEERIEPCQPQSSNLSKLHHYFLKVTPDPADEARKPSRICHNDKKYYFEGFSVFFHRKLPQCFPQSSLNKVSQEFDVVFMEEQPPQVKDV
uniref:RNA-binding protein 33 n=1 Tax=Steinernema glaseri TaxID=37863 RepID=A0A1I7ZIF6_9BILA